MLKKNFRNKGGISLNQETHFSKRTLPEVLTRLFLFSIGVSIIAAGGSLFILSNTGSDPFNVFMQGVARILHISNGISCMGINAVYLVVIFIFARNYIRIGTIASIFICGPMIDLVSSLLSPYLSGQEALWIRIPVMLAGTIVLSFGLAMVMSADAGVAPNDLASIIISDKTHIAFRWVRIAVDSTLVLLGFLLGGVVGIGTIAGAVLTGPTAQFFSPFHLKLTRRVIQSALRLLKKGELTNENI